MREARLAKLQAAQLYLCTPEPLAPPGAAMVQLRRKGLEWREELALLRRLRECALATAAASGSLPALVSANDRADVAAFAPVDVLHLGQDDLPPALARRIVGPEVLIGLSTHDEHQLAVAAADPDIDYFCVGPVWERPPRPDAQEWASGSWSVPPRWRPRSPHGAHPWFVTGGVAPQTLDDVLATGARRVVVVRAITGAPDPAAVSVELARRLREAAGQCAT